MIIYDRNIDLQQTGDPAVVAATSEKNLPQFL